MNERSNEQNLSSKLQPSVSVHSTSQTWINILKLWNEYECLKRIYWVDKYSFITIYNKLLIDFITMLHSNSLLFTEPECEWLYRDMNIWDEYRWIQGLPRKWWVDRGIPHPESVAEHSISAALMVTHRFHKEIEHLGLDVPTLQKMLLIHDIHEPRTLGLDITPQDGIDPEEKTRRECTAVNSILRDKPLLLSLWQECDEWKTAEWRIAKEIDKLQAIEKARFYEKLHGKEWLTKEFHTYAVLTKKQIQTGFLLTYAQSLLEYDSIPE